MYLDHGWDVSSGGSSFFVFVRISFFWVKKENFLTSESEEVSDQKKGGVHIASILVREHHPNLEFHALEERLKSGVRNVSPEKCNPLPTVGWRLSGQVRSTHPTRISSAKTTESFYSSTSSIREATGRPTFFFFRCDRLVSSANIVQFVHPGIVFQVAPTPEAVCGDVNVQNAA